jgi:large subunit ribosomal protein L16
VAATHFLHREGKVYLRIFPHKPVSAKPLETRMGKGKGETAFWVARVRPGMIMFEIGGIGENVAKQALARVAHKMPIKCRLVKRRRSV